MKHHCAVVLIFMSLVAQSVRGESTTLEMEFGLVSSTFTHYVSAGPAVSINGDRVALTGRALGLIGMTQPDLLVVVSIGTRIGPVTAAAGVVVTAIPPVSARESLPALGPYLDVGGEVTLNPNHKIGWGELFASARLVAMLSVMPPYDGFNRISDTGDIAVHTYSTLIQESPLDLLIRLLKLSFGLSYRFPL